MTVYVCGFLFDPKLKRVVLIRKNRGPRKMAGHLNGVGGKIEIGESPRGAMAREFKEETGLDVPGFNWTCFHSEYYWCDSGNKVYFMAAVSEDIDSVVTAEDEEISIHYIADGRLPVHKAPMYNLCYLIPMALCWLTSPGDRYFEG